ncbi:hypothetical protein ACFV6B_08480 [Streptomyces microflavus]
MTLFNKAPHVQPSHTWHRLAIAAVGGLCSGAARALIAWLLARLPDHD